MKIREVTLRRGKAEYESPTPAKIDLTPTAACGGKRRRTKATMVVSTDGTCASCAKKDLEDYLHFLRIARGSAYELEAQLVLAQDLGLCADERG